MCYDPDGRLAFLIPVAIFIGKELAAEGLSYATGGASDIVTDVISVRRLGTKGVKLAAKALRLCCFVVGIQVLTRTGYKKPGPLEKALDEHLPN